MLARYFLLFKLFCWAWVAGAAPAVAAPTVVKHFDYAYSPALRPYLYDVLELILELTEAEFGPFEIEVCQENLSAARAKIETEKGVILNVLFSSGWDGELVNRQQVIGYRFPAFNDMLGLRSLVVPPGTEISDNPPRTRAAFREFSAGLGYYWEDVAILRNAGIRVVEAQTFDALFPMLVKKRFDYLPLSILEVAPTLRRKERQYGDIHVHPSLKIFYPMDFQLYVNKATPGLAQRIALGLEKARGKPLEKVFMQHFAQVIPTDSAVKKLFIVDNHTMPGELNKATIDRFLSKYGDHFDVME